MAKKPKYYIRPDGLHEAIRVIDGKRIAFRGKNDAEVERKMLEYKQKTETGRAFRVVADQWKDAHFPTLAHNTLRNYSAPLQRAIDEYGDTPIKEIKAPDIKRFLNEFARGGRAKKTVFTQKLILNLVFTHAIECGDVEINPCTHVSLPKNLSKSHRTAASVTDEAKIKASWDKWLLPYFILYTGLRKGEVLAIQGKDINLEADEVYVTKSIYFEHNKPKIKSPKTQKGHRTVPILMPLKEKLPKIEPEDFLFSPDNGTSPYPDKQFRTLWANYAKDIGIDCTPHQLRHSFATMLFENDVDVRDAQDLMGHTTLAMTQDVYTHIRESRRKSVAKFLNEKLSENTENTQEAP